MISRTWKTIVIPITFAVGWFLVCEAMAFAEQALSTDVLTAKEPFTDAEEYGRGVRTTDPRTPLGELQGFHVPEGVVVELVASEPAIAKPLNMAFDWRGRLWITQTYEYPYPYDAAKDLTGTGPRDAIVILEDTDGDGYREKATTFAEGLNIPMGLLPYRDGVICFNIPNLVFLRDTDGDSVCDQQETILGPFDTTRDTHGMVNSLRWMPDGWIMANHGFNNNSIVRGRDGKQVILTSGNVFRFRPDGSSIELYAQGQVNPFGMTIDQYGFVFTADCHSKPISQVLLGGCYQSFGRPHDGLGFVPDIMSHLHGSTAIAGLENCAGSNLPFALHSQLVSGNVMTSRINRNQLQRNGLTCTAVEQKDLLTSDDSWFRPVDLRLGPDGWLYVADFYNRIIGHYEVPLAHEGRDRFRGRIWRIGSSDAPSTDHQWSLQTASQCVEALAHDNPTVVRLALQRLEELAGANSKEQVAIELHNHVTSKHLAAKLWAKEVWQRPNRVDEDLLKLCLSQDDLVATHALQALALRLNRTVEPASASQVRQVAADVLQRWREVPHAASSAARLLAVVGDEHDAKALLEVAVAARQTDPMLYMAFRISLRELLKRDAVKLAAVEGWVESTMTKSSSEETTTHVAKSPLIAIDSEPGHELFQVLIALPAGSFPLDAGLAYLNQNKEKQDLPQEVLSAIVSAITEEEAIKLIQFLDNRYASDLQAHLRQLAIVAQSLQEQGKLYQTAKDAIAKFVVHYVQHHEISITEPTAAGGGGKLDQVQKPTQLVSWFGSEGQGRPSETVWLTEQRRNSSADADAQIPVFSSFTLGESYTGKLVSAPFRAAGLLSFYVCGHNGLPSEADTHQNRVELVNAMSNEVLAVAYPPRSDIAQAVVWDLGAYDAELFSIQLVDGDPRSSYAWIGAGGFEPGGLSPSDYRDDMKSLFNLLGLVGGLAVEYQQMHPRGLDNYQLVTWQLLARRPLELKAALAIWSYKNRKFSLANQLAEDVLSAESASDVLVHLAQVAQASDAASQRQLVELLASQSHWHEALLTTLQQGWISKQALLVLPQAWWQANSNQPLVAELLKLRPSESEDVAKRMEKFVTLRSQIESQSGNAGAGKLVFEQQCAACHQFAGQGKVVGPQLEGVGGRGLARLCEDILLPNQNVDHAFHTAAILTTEGEVITGLVRQREPSRIVLADSKGQERTISTSDVESEKASGLSLMPENFGEVLSPQQLADLIQYLRKPNDAK